MPPEQERKKQEQELQLAMSKIAIQNQKVDQYKEIRKNCGNQEKCIETVVNIFMKMVEGGSESEFNDAINVINSELTQNEGVISLNGSLIGEEAIASSLLSRLNTVPQGSQQNNKNKITKDEFNKILLDVTNKAKEKFKPHNNVMNETPIKVNREEVEQFFKTNIQEQKASLQQMAQKRNQDSKKRTDLRATIKSSIINFSETDKERSTNFSKILNGTREVQKPDENPLKTIFSYKPSSDAKIIDDFVKACDGIVKEEAHSKKDSTKILSQLDGAEKTEIIKLAKEIQLYNDICGLNTRTPVTLERLRLAAAPPEGELNQQNIEELCATHNLADQLVNFQNDNTNDIGNIAIQLLDSLEDRGREQDSRSKSNFTILLQGLDLINYSDNVNIDEGQQRSINLIQTAFINIYEAAIDTEESLDAMDHEEFRNSINRGSLRNANLIEYIADHENQRNRIETAIKRVENKIKNYQSVQLSYSNPQNQIQGAPQNQIQGDPFNQLVDDKNDAIAAAEAELVQLHQRLEELEQEKNTHSRNMSPEERSIFQNLENICQKRSDGIIDQEQARNERAAIITEFTNTVNNPNQFYSFCIKENLRTAARAGKIRKTNESNIFNKTLHTKHKNLFTKIQNFGESFTNGSSKTKIDNYFQIATNALEAFRQEFEQNFEDSPFLNESFKNLSEKLDELTGTYHKYSSIFRTVDYSLNAQQEVNSNDINNITRVILFNGTAGFKELLTRTGANDYLILEDFNQNTAIKLTEKKKECLISFSDHIENQAKTTKEDFHRAVIDMAKKQTNHARSIFDYSCQLDSENKIDVLRKASIKLKDSEFYKALSGSGAKKEDKILAENIVGKVSSLFDNDAIQSVEQKIDIAVILMESMFDQAKSNSQNQNHNKISFLELCNRIIKKMDNHSININTLEHVLSKLNGISSSDSQDMDDQLKQKLLLIDKDEFECPEIQTKAEEAGSLLNDKTKKSFIVTKEPDSDVYSCVIADPDNSIIHIFTRTNDNDADSIYHPLLQNVDQEKYNSIYVHQINNSDNQVTSFEKISEIIGRLSSSEDFLYKLNMANYDTNRQKISNKDFEICTNAWEAIRGQRLLSESVTTEADKELIKTDIQKNIVTSLVNNLLEKGNISLSPFADSTNKVEPQKEKEKGGKQKTETEKKAEISSRTDLEEALNEFVNALKENNLESSVSIFKKILESIKAVGSEFVDLNFNKLNQVGQVFKSLLNKETVTDGVKENSTKEALKKLFVSGLGDKDNTKAQQLTHIMRFYGPIISLTALFVSLGTGTGVSIAIGHALTTLSAVASVSFTSLSLASPILPIFLAISSACLSIFLISELTTLVLSKDNIKDKYNQNTTGHKLITKKEIDKPKDALLNLIIEQEKQKIALTELLDKCVDNPEQEKIEEILKAEKNLKNVNDNIITKTVLLKDNLNSILEKMKKQGEGKFPTDAQNVAGDLVKNCLNTIKLETLAPQVEIQQRINTIQESTVRTQEIKNAETEIKNINIENGEVIDKQAGQNKQPPSTSVNGAQGVNQAVGLVK